MNLYVFSWWEIPVFGIEIPCVSCEKTSLGFEIPIVGSEIPEDWRDNPVIHRSYPQDGSRLIGGSGE